MQSRRLELIAKEHAHGLSDDEASALESLQQAAAKASEPADKALLQRLSRIEETAGRSISEA